MHLHQLLPSLNLATMLIVAVALAAALLYFIRRPSNRHPLDGREERNVAADLDRGAAPPDHSPRT